MCFCFSLWWSSSITDKATTNVFQKENVSLSPRPSCLTESSSLTVGLGLNVPSVAGRCSPATGCGGLGAACTTWPASPATPARGSCRPARSSAWWRAGCCAGATTTSCWTTCAGLQRTVTQTLRRGLWWQNPPSKEEYRFYYYSHLNPS